MDPIEKKPLYHYRPGSSILSLGFAGCNLRCPFCQNWHISQSVDVPGRFLPPEEIIAAVLRENDRGGTPAQIAYTYSEPLVHVEFLLDCMALARKAGIANALITNGCLNAEAGEEILKYTDAANIDLKCFSDETYARLLGGELQTVLEFIQKARALGVHTEITTLIIPGLNDGEREIEQCVDFLAGLSPEIPWHLSAYHPDYKWEAPPTDPSRLEETARQAKRALSYVYTGNISGGLSDTSCPHCGRLLVRRRGYSVDTGGLRLKKRENGASYCCAHCGGAVPISH
jgi:pyruvate formate lyase activating enzyme